MLRKIVAVILIVLMITSLTACDSGGDSASTPSPRTDNIDDVSTTPPDDTEETPKPDNGGDGDDHKEPIDLEKALEEETLEGSESEEMELNMDVIAEAPAVVNVLMPEASGEAVYGNDYVAVDASNVHDGYVMVRYTGGGSARLKVRITGPSGTNYDYNLNTWGEYEVFPISDGSGYYTVGVFQNVEGSKYSTLFQTGVQVDLNDEFAPFLLPNQYVNYHSETLAVREAVKIVGNETDQLKVIQLIYEYVVENYSYDFDKAATVQSGYLPDLDQVFEAKAGICFDYAAIMAAMLRSLDIPTKLVVGNAGSVYHAWISCYSEETGWLDGLIFFDGKQWQLMDPTFASSSGGDSEIMEFIGNGNNYSAKYLY